MVVGRHTCGTVPTPHTHFVEPAEEPKPEEPEVSEVQHVPFVEDPENTVRPEEPEEDTIIEDPAKHDENVEQRVEEELTWQQVARRIGKAGSYMQGIIRTYVVQE